MLFLLGIFVGIVTLWLVNVVQRRREICKYMGHFPSSLPRNPVFGGLLNLPKEPSDIFMHIMNDHKRYGKNVGLWGLLNDHQLFLSDPEDVEKILSNSKLIQKSIEYSFLHDWLGTGLLMATGKKWHARRKIITPTFHFKILEQFVKIFNSQTEVMVDKVKKYAESGQEFNVYKYTTLCALDVICEASMGTKINAQELPDSEYVSAVKEMGLIFFKRFFSLSKQWPWAFPITKLGRRQKQLLKVLHGFTEGVITSRRTLLMAEMENKEETEKELNSDKKMCFLDLLLHATIEGQPLTNADIREEVDTFMFEGHDTTTSGVSFTLHHLSQHPEIQERVYEEIVSVLATKDKNVYLDYAALQELKYLEMVIKESLRITPPVPVIGRELTEDTVLGGVTVPTGTTVTIAIFAMHHDKDSFPDPLKFDPERFSVENSQKRSPYAFIPFSAGNRNCVGQKFAMLEVKSMVAKMLLNFKLLPGKTPLTLQSDMVLKSKNGVFIRIENR